MKKIRKALGFQSTLDFGTAGKGLWASLSTKVSKTAVATTAWSYCEKMSHQFSDYVPRTMLRTWRTPGGDLDPQWAPGTHAPTQGAERDVWGKEKRPGLRFKGKGSETAPLPSSQLFWEKHKNNLANIHRLVNVSYKNKLQCWVT